jgi:hypothetical protein
VDPVDPDSDSDPDPQHWLWELLAGVFPRAYCSFVILCPRVAHFHALSNSMSSLFYVPSMSCSFYVPSMGWYFYALPPWIDNFYRVAVCSFHELLIFLFRGMSSSFFKFRP